MEINQKKLLSIFSFFLVILAVSSLSVGFYYLAFHEAIPMDLRVRWVEQQYIYREYYPYPIGDSEPFVIPEIGPVNSGGYFPWSFFSSIMFFPPLSLEITRFYHLFLNLGGLVILGTFAYQVGAKYGRKEAIFSVAAALAINGHIRTLVIGQYGIIINALLILMFWLLQRDRNKLAGLVYGIALLKPNISALFFFILVLQRRYWAIITCLGYVGLGTLIIWRVTATNPVEMVMTVFRQSKSFADQGSSSVNFLVALGLNPDQAVLLLAPVAMAIVLLLFYQFRFSPLLTQFAIATVIGRVSTYHRNYDDLMVVFLLLALIDLGFRSPKLIHSLALALVAISLYLPARFTVIELVANAQLIIWFCGLVYLILFESFEKRVTQSSHTFPSA